MKDLDYYYYYYLQLIINLLCDDSLWWGYELKKSQAYVILHRVATQRDDLRFILLFLLLLCVNIQTIKRTKYRQLQ